MGTHTGKVCARSWHEAEENEVITSPYGTHRNHPFPKLKMLSWISEEDKQQASHSFLRKVSAFSDLQAKMHKAGNISLPHYFRVESILEK